MMSVKVFAAQYAGACYGVQRALDMAQNALDSNVDVTSLGPLIHNPLVVSKLEQAGIAVAETVGAIKTDHVLIRSHGITPQLKAEIDSMGLSVVDATCPYVYRAQKAAERLAFEHDALIIVGQSGHPEVEALEAYGLLSNKNVFVVAGACELPHELPISIGVVVQTTQKASALDEVLAALDKHGCEVEVANTICTATQQRQQAAASLAAQVDAMVVIGGRNSANTTRLAEICAERGRATYHIESASELRSEWFTQCATIGVTAGASTPQSQIDEVMEYLTLL